LRLKHGADTTGFYAGGTSNFCYFHECRKPTRGEAARQLLNEPC